MSSKNDSVAKPLQTASRRETSYLLLLDVIHEGDQQTNGRAIPLGQRCENGEGLVIITGFNGLVVTSTRFQHFNVSYWILN